MISFGVRVLFVIFLYVVELSVGRFTFILFSPASFNSDIFSFSFDPLVVIAMSSIPFISAVLFIISVRSFLSSGSPPVYFIFFIPSCAATFMIFPISFGVLPRNSQSLASN